jgi:hypothetical protein
MLLLVLDIVDRNFDHFDQTIGILIILSPLVLMASGRCPNRWMSLIYFDIRMVEINYCA